LQPAESKREKKLEGPDFQGGGVSPDTGKKRIKKRRILKKVDEGKIIGSHKTLKHHGISTLSGV